MQRYPTSRICGMLVVAVAVLLLLGRAPGLSTLYDMLPGGERMGLLNMAMMACAGYAIAVLEVPWRQMAAARRASVLLCLLVLTLLPLGFIVETVFDIALGIDLAAAGARPSAAIPHPGRTSPNGALAMLMIGVALACQLSPRPGLRASVGGAAAAMVAMIGVAALIGHALGLQDLYRLAGFNRLLPLTAVVLCVCAVGLWSLLYPAAAARTDDHTEARINRRSAVLFAFVAVIGGVAGFAVLRSSFEEATASNLLLTTHTTAASIANEIESNLWYPKVIVARTSVRSAMTRLSSQAGAVDRAATASLSQLAERYFDEQVTGAQFLSANGTVLFSAGILSIRDATVKHILQGSGGGAILFWADGYVLETRNDIVDHGRTVGVLVVETRLPRIHALLAEVQESGATTDTALCSVVASGVPAAEASFACGPTRFQRSFLLQPMQADPGSVAGSLALALGGVSGTGIVNDTTDSASIISAYTPVSNFGLALGVTSAVESLYAPLRGRVLQLLLVLAAVVAGGTLILRRLVRPLVTALGRAQRRTARILEGCNDAFVALDEHGLITDWNAQAARLFGWTADEAHGRHLASLILHTADHAKLAAAMDDSGRDNALNHRIELRASHRDGRQLPVELSLKSELTDDGYLAHVFIQDISARQAAREALRQSEKRLRLIANNLPVLVSYIDRDFRYRFTNKSYQRWFNLPPDALAGKTISDVFGHSAFETVRVQIEQALAGAEVSFELDNTIAGAPAKLQVHYLPDRDRHGKVIGVFGMVLDNTTQHELQARLAASEHLLDAFKVSPPA